VFGDLMIMCVNREGSGTGSGFTGTGPEGAGLVGSSSSCGSDLIYISCILIKAGGCVVLDAAPV
jgi:hypothetical protein